MPGAQARTVAAWCRAELSTQENRNLALLDLVVDPARRRGGLGTALLRHAAGEAAADGRVSLRGTVQEGSAGEAFARQAGATQGMTDIRRVLELRAIPAGQVARLRECGVRAAAGYSLVRWEGLTPTRGWTRSLRCATR
jgi:GNAT superfamily N-acetyltransferase